MYLTTSRRYFWTLSTVIISPDALLVHGNRRECLFLLEWFSKLQPRGTLFSLYSLEFMLYVYTWSTSRLSNLIQLFDMQYLSFRPIWSRLMCWDVIKMAPTPRFAVTGTTISWFHGDTEWHLNSPQHNRHRKRNVELWVHHGTDKLSDVS